jgi:hypothetical protein
MSCREYRSGLIEWGRGRVPGEAVRQVLTVHLEECAECARFLETQQALTAAMADISAEPIPPASQFLAPVMDAFDRAHPPRAVHVIPTRLALLAALAAAILLAVISLPHRTPRRQAAPRPISALTERQSAPRLAVATTMDSPKRPASPRPASFHGDDPEPDRPFYPIPYTAPLAPGEWTRVVRMKIPVGALIAMGFQVMLSDPAATVEADVLVSQDGRARAIRPLSISNSN